MLYLAAGLLLHFFWLVNGGARHAVPWFGGPSLALGFGMMIWARSLFHKAGTAVHPFEESKLLVQVGPYRRTRNPMYLGMTLILLGISFFAGSPPVFLTPLAFFLTLGRIFVPYEEKKMEAAFGETYRGYKRRVRRWI